ncbi:LLM class flavin-dependent oxidoreductase [Staphylococcus succinus]|uniref:LLM class flavin-dependent oxidoreductase n=1 Tax=Staphylococcus succinus TaxID=61015 RepID=UPI000D1DA6C0|nr:LLM class flavin-dependent oxidoreductase [Staphylococcus succinus]MBU0438116.1 LLM class flavin-dependent oxidoreductase [Staphylococcus succinus]MEB7462359.1 LLM class flavin-dependent oxidoreductase [Staphylococcus succinus]PTI47990.1 LLM class flavin-dependent oxidoreductase [Staphylococcus succinus]
MKLSILDYVPIFEGQNAAQALNHTIELAQLAERLGFHRYWVAEHHQVFSVASSAPEMVMMSLLENTSTIHIGSGGVMLPHYSAYKVAEQFKIMEARHPGRVNLGTGHSPSFKNVNHALNEHKSKPVDYDTQISDLVHYFNDDTSDQTRFTDLYATPIINSKPIMYILGMSMKSATLAAQQGLSFVIALMGQSKDNVSNVIEHYRNLFKQLHHDKQPYVIISTFVITASTSEQLSSLERAFHLWLLRINYLDQPKSYPSIQYAKARDFSDRELLKVEKNKRRVISGMPAEIIKQLKAIRSSYEVDEIMIQPHIFGEKNRKNMLDLIAREIDLTI